MGLDISVVINLSRIDPQPTDANEDDYIYIGKHNYFEQQADGLTGYYEGEYTKSFRAGSYSGYNDWREKLCHMALGIEPDVIWENPNDFKGKPFVELINFADCEGTIGPQTSAKLYQDFLDYDEMASQYTELTSEEEATIGLYKTWFYDKYKDWTDAFRSASTQNGAVLFH